MTGRTCAAPGCDNPVARKPGPGRPPIYCSVGCRPSYRPRPAITVDLDHDDTTPRGGGWAVTLRRGASSVTVASDLGRFAATLLRDDLHQLLHPHTKEAPHTT